MLSVHALSKDDLYLRKAEELVQQMIRVFESPSGIPFSRVILGSGEPVQDGGVSVLSEFGTLQLELRYLSRATGKPEYAKLGDMVLDIVQ